MCSNTYWVLLTNTEYQTFLDSLDAQQLWELVKQNAETLRVTTAKLDDKFRNWQTTKVPVEPRDWTGSANFD